ncbi:glycoside hydrolase family 3 N-terminal domain-containing protein [Alteromonas flava]|uniref:glycoside hydrolase family 3 N-terminal domain-containing protein n=1 Tax=Alteromonas flava TaxID=2048003 RepID=UPI001F0B90B1|nr:glycoside hydrolase family 3 N-terminal domain-containing protein [Alteromonas flava]
MSKSAQNATNELALSAHRTDAENLLAQMTLSEKLGQMNQLNGENGQISTSLAAEVRKGNVGSIINEVDPNTVAELQRIARQESRLGIPLLVGRDVIHGFATIFPIPLGLACSWNETLVHDVARFSACEASSVGINWTFSPMIDVARDPRWGRIAESFGEDPLLASRLGNAMVCGYQTDDPTQATAIAACAKHFAGYGASESGKDYNTTNLSEHELRHVYLPPFKAASDVGAMTFMTSFSDLNGVPVSANKWLLTDILKDEWAFIGFVVSDWASVDQLIVHGIAADRAHAADLALNAGVDMEMVSQTFIENAAALLEQGRIKLSHIDQAVLRILQVKLALGLFTRESSTTAESLTKASLDLAYEAALQSCVLLQNRRQVLPLEAENLKQISVLGFLADDDYEQLGTWIFDGRAEHSTTLLSALHGVLPATSNIHYHPVFEHSRDTSHQNIVEAAATAGNSDAVILCLGEEAILSGEAHCRADITLPGAQATLVHTLAETLKGSGKPLILVIMAGRPLVLTELVDKVDAILYAWHPGHRGGDAIADLLVGNRCPEGKLPVSFPRHGGQIPIYYAHKNTGRPVTHDNYAHMNEFPMRAEQTSLGMAASHMDTYFTPLYSFGYGLSYACFEYSALRLSQDLVKLSERFKVYLSVHNNSHVAGTEIVQLYMRDPVANVTRPVKELLDFQRVELNALESKEVCFEVDTARLGFYNQSNQYCVEAGEFWFGVGPDSDCELSAKMTLVAQ